jgi:hypothetical protein
MKAKGASGDRSNFAIEALAAGAGKAGGDVGDDSFDVLLDGARHSAERGQSGTRRPGMPLQGSTPQTCQFTTPAALPNGTYDLSVSSVGVQSKTPARVTEGARDRAGPREPPALERQQAPPVRPARPARAVRVLQARSQARRARAAPRDPRAVRFRRAAPRQRGARLPEARARAVPEVLAPPRRTPDPAREAAPPAMRRDADASRVSSGTPPAAAGIFAVAGLLLLAMRRRHARS